MSSCCSAEQTRAERAIPVAAVCGARTLLVPVGSWEAASCPAFHYCEAVLSVTPTCWAYSLRFMLIEDHKTTQNAIKMPFWYHPTTGRSR